MEDPEKSVNNEKIDPAESEEDEDEDEEVPAGSSSAANVEAALSAIKAAKEKSIGKKIQKKKKKAANANARKAKKKVGIKKSVNASDGDGAQADGEEEEKPLRGLQECIDFTTTISALKPSSAGSASGSKDLKEQRIKHSLDDFLGSLTFARENLSITISDEESSRSKQFLISLYLELAYCSEVALNGKIFRTYSQFREESQKIFYAAHQRLCVGQVESDPLQLAKDLMAAVSVPVS